MGTRHEWSATSISMNPQYYYLLHIFALFVLVAHTFLALANPAPENRGKTLMVTGIAALLVLVAGFGLLAKLHANQFSGWVIVKLVCWLALAAIPALVYRRPAWRNALAYVTLLLVLVALLMVYVVRSA